jgi:hypothetical protein
MDKETYDLIDTALKVGLGALISGGSAYLLSITNFNKSKESEKRERNINFYHDIANHIESARLNHENATHPFWYHNVDSAEFTFVKATKESLKTLNLASADIGKARAISALLGLDHIKIELVEAENVIQAIFEVVATNDATKEADKLNEMSNKFREKLDLCLQDLAFHYENA